MLLRLLSGQALGAIVKVFAGFGVNSVALCLFLPASDGDIDVQGIKINSDANPTCLFSRHNSRSRTEECVENGVATLGYISDCVGNHQHWLDGRVRGDQHVPVSTERIHAPIRPQIRTITSVPAELDVVGMARGANLEHADQLVLASVKRTHSGGCFCPNAQVKESQTALAASNKDFVRVAPIHAGVDQSAVRRRSLQYRKRFGQERDELVGVEFADTLDKLAVVSTAVSRHKPLDRDVVRRVDEAHSCSHTFTDLIDEGLIVCVTAADVVVTAAPDVPEGRNSRLLRSRNLLAILNNVEFWNVCL